MGLSKRFFHQQYMPKPENYITESYAQNISDRVILSLDKTKASDALDSPNNKVKFLKQHSNQYLSNIPVDKATEILIVDQSGEIIASNVKDPREKLIFKSQEMLINLRHSDSNSFKPNQLQKLNLQTIEQQFLGVITSWQNQQLGLNWFVLVAVPKTTHEINSAISKPNIFLYYLFFGTILGTSTTIGLILLANKFTLLLNPPLFSSHHSNQEQEQKVLPGSKQNIEVEKREKNGVNTNEHDPYFLLADMSHELRSPLNAILGFSQIIEQELTKKAETNQEHIAIINHSGTRLLEIINDLVDLAKIETKRLTLERNKVDLNIWLDQIEQNINFQVGRPDWNFSLIRKPDLPQGICIDERRLKQVLGNLIDYCVNLQPNANITLTVSSESELTTVKLKKPSTSSHKLTLCFKIESSDCVVASTEIETLFKPLVRVRKAHQPSHGSSLNLPLSRHLAQLMGGDITVKTQTSNNTGITLDFRLQTESTVVQELQLQSTVRRIIGLESSPIKYRILIVDDSKTNRQIMSHLLTPVGFEVQEAVNGKEAVDVWLRWQPHMIWMDLRMPVMNGYEATEKIRSHAGKLHTPIVGLSASTLEEEKSLFWAAGCDDFVGKPFSENTIFDKIAQHLSIRYVYESIPDPEANNYRLTKESLNFMPNLWISQIEQAAVALNQDLIIQLLQEIPPANVDLTKALQKLVNNFEFDRILSLAQTSKNN